MIRKARLFTPGPTPLLPEAQAALASPALHHRTAAFRVVLDRVRENLKYFFGTSNDVIFFASSGTGSMEAAVSNFFSAGDRVLVATAGKFGERWVQLGNAFGLRVEKVEAPYGQTVPLEKIRETLERFEDIKGIFFQATESSTGARHDTEAIARLRRIRPEALVIVDAITGLGTTDLDIDGWGLDLVIGGSQKALMVPPGLSFVSVSERAWERSKSAKLPRYYFDLLKEREALQKHDTAYTPATSLLVGLVAALDQIRQLGRENLIRNAQTLADCTRHAAQALGLKLFAEVPADALTAVCAPAGINSSDIEKQMKETFGAVVANGQGSMKGKIFRIAHLGYYDFTDMLGVIATLEIVLSNLGHPSKFGEGVRAAQTRYVELTTPVQEPAAR
ncbi:MAG: alanine--glyoxylate aminotransferase family protein [Acidobacteria bacterium]|nr:alanine--glyoxylate aminotransferase family protein [Acidobacteriota bacterium]